MDKECVITLPLHNDDSNNNANTKKILPLTTNKIFFSGFALRIKFSYPFPPTYHHIH